MEMKPPNMSAVRRFRDAAMARKGAAEPAKAPRTLGNPIPGLKVATRFGRGGAELASGIGVQGGASELGGGAWAERRLSVGRGHPRKGAA